MPFVRLRTVDGRHTFTLKRPVENALACNECETSVADREQMPHAIVAMGFYPTVRVVKVRRTATLDGVSVCVDKVDALRGAQVTLTGRPAVPRTGMVLRGGAPVG